MSIVSGGDYAVSVPGFVTAFRFVFGSSHSSCKFLRLFPFAAFLHSSCSVVVSYFMFILVFVNLLFSFTVFRSTIG